MFCKNCGNKVNGGNFCPRCGYPISENDIGANMGTGYSNFTVNSSGMGICSAVPEGIKRWNWGAFFLSWIWGLGDNTFIALLALIPYFGLVIRIVLGIKGNEWAWQNKHWNSIEEFHRVQRKWAVWGAIIAGIILSFILLVFFSLTWLHPHTIIIKSHAAAYTAAGDFLI